MLQTYFKHTLAEVLEMAYSLVNTRKSHDKLSAMAAQHTWPSILGALVAKTDLSREQAQWAMTQIMSGEAEDSQVGAFMLALRSKGESVQELAGLVDIMLEHAVLLQTGSDAVDIVGTGGDQAGTVNISSMSAILAAAAGVPVMKHGSRSASGRTGASEMLEVLGVRLDLTPEQVAEVFSEVGITFFFAPVFHPAMRYVAPIRKALGVPTTFNFLGPLANPAQPIATSLGVANQYIAPLMAAEMASRGRTALVFRGSDGLDEITTTGTTHIWQVSGGEVREFELNPLDLGLKLAKLDDLVGGDAHFNAKTALMAFGAEPADRDLSFVQEVVLLNAAGGLVAYQLAKQPESGEQDITERFASAIEKLKPILLEGAAAEKLSAWIESTQQM